MAMKKGDKGTNVRELQEQLQRLGFYSGKIDGSFGGATDRAVKAFQAKHGLEQDGHVGPATRAALSAAGGKSKYEILTLDQLLQRLEAYNHKELHVHHTWRPDHKTYASAAAKNEDERALQRQQAFYDYHVNTRGWKDIGQHVTLLPDGRFVTGRDFGSNPASIQGHNSGAFACEMIGNFDTGHDSFRGPQRESMIGLARWFDGRGKYVRFHRENAAKTCPGTGISKANFMAEVRMQPAPKPVPEPSGAVYRIQVGAFYTRSAAGNAVAGLKEDGYRDIFIVQS
jgi:hypothetical protein